jgi:hypothetical protein
MDVDVGPLCLLVINFKSLSALSVHVHVRSCLYLVYQISDWQSPECYSGLWFVLSYNAAITITITITITQDAGATCCRLRLRLQLAD